MNAWRNAGRANVCAPNVLAPSAAGSYGRLDAVQPEPPWHLAQPPSVNSCRPRAIACGSASFEAWTGLIVLTNALMSSQSLCPHAAATGLSASSLFDDASAPLSTT